MAAVVAPTLLTDSLTLLGTRKQRLPALGASNHGKDQSFAMDGDVLVRRIRIVLANHSHLDRVVADAFQIAWGTKQQVNETTVSSANCLAPVAEATVEFEMACDLLFGILERIQLPFGRAAVLAWISDACRTFAHSRGEADAVSESKVGFVVDWVMQCLAESTVRRSPSAFYNRQFLVGMGYDTSLVASGLELTGPVAYGVYGNVWLHAKLKQLVLGQNQSVRASSRLPVSHPSARSRNSVHHGSNTKGLGGGKRQEHVVISIRKQQCRVPPQILSKRIQQMISMEKLPYVLPLCSAYEDYEHIHLVYEALSPHSIGAVDKMFDDLHKLEDDLEGTGISERLVQQFIWKIMSMLKPAHSRGLVHGCLRMGCIYLNDPADLDTLEIIEFGLYDLFEIAQAAPPLAVLTPLEIDPLDPVPPYRRDFQCVAEITYLMLGGQPLCPVEFSAEQRKMNFKRGTVSFADKVFSKISEIARSFVVELLRPPQFKKSSKIQAFHEAAVHMGHRWFQPAAEQDFDQLAEMYDVGMVRRYDKWRNMIRLRTVFLKIISDNIALLGIGQLRKALEPERDEYAKVSWTQLVGEIQRLFPAITADLLKKVSKAFGENANASVIHVADLCEDLEAWRRKRVHEILWQIFNRAKALDGVMELEGCIEGLTAGVQHVWSRPMRVIDVVLPPLGVVPLAATQAQRSETRANDELEARIEELLLGQNAGRFQDLCERTDARNIADQL